MYQLSEDLKDLVSHIRMKILQLKQENDRLNADCAFLRNEMLGKEALLEKLKIDIEAMRVSLDDSRESELLAKMMLEEVVAMFEIAAEEKKIQHIVREEVLQYEYC